MTELSKIASNLWKTLPEEEKNKWKRQYEINRDLPQNTDYRKQGPTEIIENSTSEYEYPDIPIKAEQED